MAANRGRCENHARIPLAGGQGKKLEGVGKIRPYRGERGGSADIPERLGHRVAQEFLQRAPGFHYHQEVFELRVFLKFLMLYVTLQHTSSPDVRFEI